MKSHIPKGYQVHFNSWENDGDNHKTAITSGLSKEDAQFLVNLAESFKNEYGNDFVSDKDIMKIVNKALSKNPDISSQMKEYFICESEDDLDEVRQNLREYVTEFPDENYEQEFCRCVDNIEVFYFREDADNVTSEFVNVKKT